MGVPFGSANRVVLEKFLNVAYICAVFPKMSGKGVAQDVNREFLGNTGAMDCLAKKTTAKPCRYKQASRPGVRKPPVLKLKAVSF